MRNNQRNKNVINILFEKTNINIFSNIRTQNQISGLMAVGELISHLQQEREGLIFRIISNATIENGYYILKYHID